MKPTKLLQKKEKHPRPPEELRDTSHLTPGTKRLGIASICGLSLLMGFLAGAVVWVVLRIMSLGIDALWTWLPAALGLDHSLPYYLIVCLIGGFLIGFLQRQAGPLPDNIEQVMMKVKFQGGYPYDKLHVIAIAALLPLIFGGALGPEAGLSGLVAGLCCWIGDRLKCKGDEIVALAGAGFAAALGVIFHAPLFGIAWDLESDMQQSAGSEQMRENHDVSGSSGERTDGARAADERADGARAAGARTDAVRTTNQRTVEASAVDARSDAVRTTNQRTVEASATDGSGTGSRTRIVKKSIRIVIYCFGVIGGMLAYGLLGKFLGGGSGLPRFNPEHAIGLSQWKWFIPLLALGIAFSLFYMLVEKLTRKLANRLLDTDASGARKTWRPVIAALIPAVLMAVCGWTLPLTMFSGEHQLEELIDCWHAASVPELILTAVLKLALVSLCVNFGWRGGSIFPIIFSGACLGYAFALIVGMDGAFAAAVVIAALYAYQMRKPVAVIMVLLLCFPITYIIPVGVSAFAGAKIPSPFARGDGHGTTDNSSLQNPA